MSFSSDSSDFEEFYDAVEGTPNSSVARSPRSPGNGMTEIERQELRLLQLRQEAEERRRREDAEFEKMMEQLRKQKAACSQDAGPRPDRAQDLQHRRQKLAEMRKRIGQETSLIYTSQDSVTDPESPDSTKELQLPSQPQTTKSATIERMESSAHAYNKELVANARRKRSGSWGDLPKDLSDLKLAASGSLPASQLGSMEGVLESGRGKLELRLPDSHSPPRDSQASPEPRAVVDDVIKDINIGGGANSQEEGSMGGEEPDIVKSTKPKGASPAPQSLPLAPPRRRKRSQTSSAAPRELDAPLPPLADPPTPVSTVASLTRELEHSLDLRSAIGGNRHITSEEADLEAVKSDTEMVDDFQVFSLEEATDDELMGGSDDETRRRQEKLPPSRERSGSRLHPDRLHPDRLPADKMQSSSPGSEEPSLSELHGRPRSNSGRLLTDEEILESVMILNLDTGERIPLNKAEEALPKCLNPLSMHIMQRTKEFSSDSSLPSAKLSDDDDARSEVSVSSSISNIGRRRPAKKLKKLFGRTVSKIKSVTEQVLHGDEGGIEEEVSFDGKIFKIKASGSNKGQHDFTQLSMLQDLSGEHTAAVWTMKFSPCGKLLATGGQDSVLRIWVLKSAVSYFEDLRSKCSSETTPPKMTKAQSKESVTSASSAEAADKDDATQGDASTAGAAVKEEEEEGEEEQGAGVRVGGKEEEDEHDRDGPFVSKPFCCYRGHQADLLDVAWSKNYFILSSSMDKTVRLWHISRRECLCTFQHIDFVTAIAFHPRDDRYFLSGSLDGKLRLWNIPDKKVTMWNEVRGSSSLITSASFCHQGKYAVAGTYDGKCIFFNTENLKYFTQIHVRSTRGRNAKGKKITGIEPMPNEDKILVTSNDSRIRLYDLRDLTLTCKYKGCTNTNSQIKAGFSSTAKYIICGSEDHFVYIWKAHHDFYKFSSARRDRNDYWEAIKVHNAVVTSAVFAPFPAHFSAAPPVPPGEDRGCTAKAATAAAAAASSEPQGEIIVSADFTGAIKVIQNRPRL